MQHAERILYVDDEELSRAAFSRSLRKGGFRLDLATDCREAEHLALQTPYAVIATDYQMPETNGLQLIDRLRSVQPDAVFILISGECDLDLTLEAINSHDVPHVLSKPWNVEELNNLLQRSIKSYWSRVGQRELQRRASGREQSLRSQKAKLDEVMEQSAEHLAQALLGALNLRDHETRAHCQRVATYTVMLMDELGVDAGAASSIRLGALLHDIGKIGVPDAILLKNGPLTDEEWEVMRTHTTLGAQLLDGMDLLRAARDVVLQHHERWDGRGYPLRLEAEEVCIGARIFAVVDTVDAILSDRPYRKGQPFEVAAAEVQKGLGTQFDPAVVAAFGRIPRAAWLKVRSEFPDERPPR